MARSHSPLGKARTVVILLCLILIVGIIAYAYLTDTNNSVLDKNKIESNLGDYENQDLGYKYISSYIKKYGIGNINSYKLNTIETHLEDEFYKELPEEHVLAGKICELYLEHFYDKVDAEDKEAVTDAIIRCLFASLGDPYAYYRNVKEFNDYMSSLEGNESFVGIGVMVDAATLEVSMVYKDSGAEAAGIRRGDIIYGVEDRTLENTSPDELTNMLRGEADTEVNVKIKRGDEFIDLKVKRMVLSERSVSYEIDTEKIGYIYISQFLNTTPAQFAEAVDYCTNNGAVALIIDVRYNPGGLLTSVVDVIDYLVPDANNRMIATYTTGSSKHTFYTDDAHGVNLPIAVLCNRGTASAGELFTAAMRDFNDAKVINAIIVGETTYGKGVVQTNRTLFDTSGITYTIGYYNPPSDVNYDGVGVIPDLPVEDPAGSDIPFDTAKSELLKIVYTNSGSATVFAPAA